MRPDIIIPTLKDPYGLAPMVCAIEGYSQGCNIIPTCLKASAAVNRNAGLERTAAPIVIMLDDDISGFYDGWVDELIRPLLLCDDIIYVTADLVNPDASISCTMFRPDGEGVVDIPRAPTAAVAFRNNGLRFDEAYIGSGFEDDDFCATLKEKHPKGRFVLNKYVKLIHANEEKGRSSENFQKNEKYFLSKWETIGDTRIRRSLNLSWRERLELHSPNDLLEIPDKQAYYFNKERYAKHGFTSEIFERLFPIMEESVYSAFQLFCLARKVPEGGTILEIGSGRGGSLCTMSLANPTAKLINIDKFGHYDEASAFGTVKDYQGFTYEGFLKNIAPFGVKPRTVLKWSQDAAGDIPDGSCDMIFIDGNHTYEPCLKDIDDYWPKLKPGGIYCGHDYHPLFPGVIKAVKERYGLGFDVLENSSIWIKTGEANA